jgi:hypothetical protein
MRTLLLTLLLFICLQAGLAGVVIWTGPQQLISRLLFDELMTLAPFHSRFLNGLWLTLAISGTHMVPVVLNWKRHRKRFYWSMASSAILLAWVFTDVFMFRNESPIMLLIAIAGSLTLLLAYTLQKEEEDSHTGAIIIRMRPRKKRMVSPTCKKTYDTNH